MEIEVYLFRAMDLRLAEQEEFEQLSEGGTRGNLEFKLAVYFNGPGLTAISF